MEEISNDQDRLWIERILSWLPISYLSLSYILFIILFAIYILFDEKLSGLDLSDRDQLLGAFFSSLIIPFEIATIKIMMDGAREQFRYLDQIFNKSQPKFNELLGCKILEKKFNYILFLIFVGFPLFLCKYDGFPFYEINGDNKFYLGLDIYANSLLIISIYLFCILSWKCLNIQLLFGMGSRALEGNLQSYNLLILRRKIVPVRNYFLFVLILFITCVSILNVSILAATTDEDYAIEDRGQPSLQTDLSIISLGIILFFAVALTLKSLKDAQSIIDNGINQKMDLIDKTIEDYSIKIKNMFEDDSDKGKNEEEKIRRENLQKILELQQKEWDKITQEKTGLNFMEGLKEAGAFVVSIIIPILSFLISK
jgi:hypothetical protein